MLNVVFRVDASSHIGMGHVMRCVALADALRGRGVTTQFVCRADPGHAIQTLERAGISVTALPAMTSTSERDDAEQTIGALRGQNPDWIVVDHYGLGLDWERRLRHRTRKLLVIDDLANRAHDCDVLLDQNYAAQPDERYRGYVTEHCRQLLGPRYALLRPDYLRNRDALVARDGAVRRVLVFFGGTDPFNLTGRTLQALSEPEFAALWVDVVVGANNPHRASIETAVAERPHTRLHGPQPHLADLMANVDLSIGAGGSTTWERMCLGLPSLVVSIAENQNPGSRALAEDNLIGFLGFHSEVGAAEIATALRDWLARPEYLVDLASRNQAVVDGWGALRVSEVMDPTPVQSLRLRRAEFTDLGLYFAWANDPATRSQALHSEPIPMSTHRRWFSNKLASEHSQLFVMLAGELPVGQVRLDREGDAAVVDYSIDPLFRGRGWASKLLGLAVEQVQEQGIIVRAQVKDANRPSCAAFLRAGFTEVPRSDTAALRTFELDPAVRKPQRSV